MLEEKLRGREKEGPKGRERGKGRWLNAYDEGGVGPESEGGEEEVKIHFRLGFLPLKMLRGLKPEIRYDAGDKAEETLSRNGGAKGHLRVS